MVLAVNFNVVGAVVFFAGGVEAGSCNFVAAVWAFGSNRVRKRRNCCTRATFRPDKDAGYRPEDRDGLPCDDKMDKLQGTLHFLIFHLNYET